MNHLWTALALSLLCGILSPLLVAKRLAFMGVSVSHSTFLGLALALCWLSPENTYGIYVVSLSITLLISLVLATVGFRQEAFDSLVGIFFSVSMGLGIVVFHLFGQGDHDDLHGYLFGDIFLVGTADTMIAWINLVLVCAAVFPFFSKWMSFVADGEGAGVAGQRGRLFHCGLVALLTLTVVSSMKVAGIVLVNAMLLIPGIFALKVAWNVGTAFVFSIVFSLVSVMSGLALAESLGTPSGATMGFIQFLIFLMVLTPVKWIVGRRKFYEARG